MLDFVLIVISYDELIWRLLSLLFLYICVLVLLTHVFKKLFLSCFHQLVSVLFVALLELDVLLESHLLLSSKIRFRRVIGFLIKLSIML